MYRKNASDIQIDDDSMYYTKDKFFKLAIHNFFYNLMCWRMGVYHPKLMSQKYNFEFFYDSALLIDPIMRLKFSFFSCPEFKFLRGS